MITTQQVNQIIHTMEHSFRGSKQLRTIMVDEQGRVSAREDLELTNRELTQLPVQFKDLGETQRLPDFTLPCCIGKRVTVRGSRGGRGFDPGSFTLNCAFW